MPYYIFKHSLSDKIIGKHYPQSEDMSNGYLYNDPHSVWQIRNERLSYTPNLDAFVLNRQSKKQISYRLYLSVKNMEKSKNL